MVTQANLRPGIAGAQVPRGYTALTFGAREQGRRRGAPAFDKPTPGVENYLKANCQHIYLAIFTPVLSAATGSAILSRDAGGDCPHDRRERPMAQLHSTEHEGAQGLAAKAAGDAPQRTFGVQMTPAQTTALGASQLDATPEVPAAVRDELERLKAERDAVVLAHYYVPPEVQAVADHVGDSFALARLAVDLPQRTIVLAGVEFMGESAKLLNPDKHVLLPEPAADCPMAHMVRRTDVDAARAQYGDDLAVVCYVNSTAQIKTWSDVCVTSSNAVKICSGLPQHNILFIPDQNLGRYVAEQLPDKHVILNRGYCPRHMMISPEQIDDLLVAHPDAMVLAHPECTAEVLAQADYIGSTKGIIEFAASHPKQTDFIVLTVVGVIGELRRLRPDARFWFPATTPTCVNMAMVTLDKLVACLREPTPHEVLVDEALAPAARVTLERMLEYAGR